VLREWGRIGCIGFGGPPTHIKLLRDLCVDRKGWLRPVEFEDAVAACIHADPTLKQRALDRLTHSTPPPNPGATSPPTTCAPSSKASDNAAFVVEAGRSTPPIPQASPPQQS
jgi:hypothetical protein